MRYSLVKAFADCCAALSALLLLTPLLLLVTLLVRWRIRSPVLYCQQRSGYHGRPFLLLKFRTMTDSRDATGALLPDSQRLTPFSRWLRATSIDELPGLINNMPLYSPEQSRRHDVKPGFSGWAQINGRNAISWEQKFCLDVWYVDHQSFWLDLRIFLLTIWKVIRREGISAAGQATMAPFTGTASSE